MRPGDTVYDCYGDEWCVIKVNGSQIVVERAAFGRTVRKTTWKELFDVHRPAVRAA